jgi:hypothetical protein
MQFDPFISTVFLVVALCGPSVVGEVPWSAKSSSLTSP